MAPIPKLSSVTNIADVMALMEQEDRAKASAVDPDVLIEKMGEEIKGQDHLIKPFAKRIASELAMTKKGAKRPLFSALLAGPPATGKTTLGQVVADTLGVPLIEINCGQKSASTIMVDMVGTPGGYGGGEGSLCKAIRATPNAVLLLDEITRVMSGPNSEFENLLMGMLGEGVIVDQRTGQRIDCTQLVIIGTSNAEMAEMRRIIREYGTQPGKMDRQCREALKNKPLGEAFLTRWDFVGTTADLPEQVMLEAMWKIICRDVVGRYSGLVVAQEDIHGVQGLDPRILRACLMWFREDPENNNLRVFLPWIKNKVSEAAVRAVRDGHTVVRLVWREDLLDAIEEEGAVEMVPVATGGSRSSAPASLIAAALDDAPAPTVGQAETVRPKTMRVSSPEI